MKILGLVVTLATLGFTFPALASGSKLPNASKRMEWARVQGVFAIDPRSSASCDKDTALEFEVLEGNFEDEPTVIVHNLTGGVRAGRPRHILKKLNDGDEQRTVDGVGGRYLEVTVQQREGWTLVEKKALYGMLIDFKPSLPKDYTGTNLEFDLFDDTVTTCKYVKDFSLGWKGANAACATVTPVSGPCIYKKVSN